MDDDTKVHFASLRILEWGFTVKSSNYDEWDRGVFLRPLRELVATSVA